MRQSTIPRAFIWRRLHSLMGLWLVLFLMEHLLVNSQAALWVGESGRGFVEMVNSIHNLPYLQVVELVLLGVPILIHLIWGIQYLLTGKLNSFGAKPSSPSFPEYKRNQAYTWQRITSWILVICIIGHVVKFRFLDYPVSLKQGTSSSYFVRLSMDNGLYTLSSRLGVTLYDTQSLQKEKEQIEKQKGEKDLLKMAHVLREEKDEEYNPQNAFLLSSAQKFQDRVDRLELMERKPLGKGEVLASSPDFGTASLLTVRDTFKNPIYAVLYTIFVLAACFHAFNGFWTFLITWGIILKMSAQKSMVSFALLLMAVVAFLGLAAVWGTYWINLKY